MAQRPMTEARIAFYERRDNALIAEYEAFFSARSEDYAKSDFRTWHMKVNQEKRAQALDHGGMLAEEMRFFGSLPEED